MSQTGAAGSRRSNRGRPSLPPPIAAFDPVGEIVVADNRAVTRAARADAFAARFGVDEAGPSADALADRFGFRYEGSDTNPAVPAGRRTVTITGRGAERSVPPAERSLGATAARERRRRSPHDSFWLQADRAALWAVGLALLLAIVAATSAHGLLLH
jgi:hypothetical protein